MSTFLDVFGALLAWGIAAAWVLTRGDKPLAKSDLCSVVRLPPWLGALSRTSRGG